MRTKIQKSRLHGKGLFTTKPVPAGDRILSERCIFSGYMRSDSLSSSQPNRIELLPHFRELDDLEVASVIHHCKRISPSESQRLTPKTLKDGSEAVKHALEQTFNKLCYPFVKDAQSTKIICLFDQVTYLNHSCNPNAEASWNDDLGKLVVYAIQDIAKDDEITISYIPFPFQPRKHRVDALRFPCRCNVCRQDSLEPTYCLLGTKLNVIAEFRAQFFDTDDFDVDFFGDANAMVEKAMNVTGAEKEDAEALIEAMNQVLRSIEAQSPAHSSLAAMFEMRYIVQAATFIRHREEQMDKSQIMDNTDEKGKSAEGDPIKEHNTDKNADGTERLPEQLTEAHLSDHGKKNGNAAPANEQIKDSGSQDKSTTTQQSSRNADDILFNNFAHLLQSDQPSSSTADASTPSEAQAILKNRDHFRQACSFKMREVDMLLRCLGIEHPRVRKAITHAWHMVEGKKAFETDLRQNLMKLGVMLKRTWTEDGDVALEIAKVGRPQRAQNAV